MNNEANYAEEIVEVNPSVGEEDVEGIDPIIFDPTSEKGFEHSFIEWENEDPADVAAHDNENSMWTDAAIKMLLAIMQELRGKVGKLCNKQIMWAEIKSKMDIQGYCFTQKQIETKFQYLERAYKKAKSHNRSTGRDRQSCPYEKELDNIFGRRPAVIPEFVLGAKLNEIRTMEEPSINTISPEPGPSRQQLSPTLPVASLNEKKTYRNLTRKKSKINNVQALMQSMLEIQRKHNEQVLSLMEKNHRENMKIHQERNEILKNFLETV